MPYQGRVNKKQASLQPYKGKHGLIMKPDEDWHVAKVMEQEERRPTAYPSEEDYD